MSTLNAINPQLRQRLEQLASERSTTIETLVEEALATYVAAHAPVRPKDQSAKLPIAQSLAFKQSAIAGLSYGKLVKALDDDLPLHKVR